MSQKHVSAVKAHFLIKFCSKSYWFSHIFLPFFLTKSLPLFHHMSIIFPGKHLCVSFTLLHLCSILKHMHFLHILMPFFQTESFPLVYHFSLENIHMFYWHFFIFFSIFKCMHFFHIWSWLFPLNMDMFSQYISLIFPFFHTYISTTSNLHWSRHILAGLDIPACILHKPVHKVQDNCN